MSFRSSTSTPEHHPYRVTFFFGPEQVSERPHLSYCVFNVKKRSWKGGVQVSVEIEQSQVARLRERLGYRAWITTALQEMAPEEKHSTLQRADDLFIQALCAWKLDLAMSQGLEQDNQTLPAQSLTLELDRATGQQPSRVIDYVKAELDLSAEF
jgi:hypothetical protein